MRRNAAPLLAFACLLLACSVHADEPLDLTRFRGKVVLVDFWASWCVPCRQSFPWLNAMQSRYADRGLVVVGVNVDAERDAAAAFLRDVPAQFPIVYDPAGAVASRYQVMGMPSSYVFGPDGTLLAQHIGFRLANREERERELLDLLARAQTKR